MGFNRRPQLDTHGRGIESTCSVSLMVLPESSDSLEQLMNLPARTNHGSEFSHNLKKVKTTLHSVINNIPLYSVVCIKEKHNFQLSRFSH